VAAILYCNIILEICKTICINVLRQDVTALAASYFYTRRPWPGNCLPCDRIDHKAVSLMKNIVILWA